MKNIRLLALIFSSLLLLQGCNIFGSEEDENNGFPESSAEIQEAAQNTSRITEQGWERVEEEISNAFSSDDLIDPNAIRQQIEKIDGVRSASPTSTGTGIVIEQEDGTHSNILIVRQDDHRLFKETTPGELNPNLIPSNQLSGSELGQVSSKASDFPNGDRKAVILAPYQSDFQTDLNQISNFLEGAGFEVDTYSNNDANLNRFRADFLEDYDVVFIRTHGAANLNTRDGTKSTIISTGERFSASREQSLSPEERHAIAVVGIDGTSYFAISVPWLNETINSSFPNSWIYVGGCETAMIDSGPESLSQAFFQHGAGGYNGFDATILTTISNPVAEKITAFFSSGKSLAEASDATRGDLGLQAKAWTIRLLGGGDAARVELLDDNQRNNDPFYLFDPDEIVGVAEIIPSSGPPETDVVYEVEINERFSNEVTSVEFDIDNTGEHITMDQVNSTLWRTDGLIAPTADNYPRVDTFTFTAFNSNNEVVGKGSATFTIQEPSSNKIINAMKNKYVRQ